MKITRRIEADYSHRITNHDSKCRFLHGHRSIIEATVIGDIVDDKKSAKDGMILDFHTLKDLMMDKIHSRLDHNFAVWEEDNICELVLRINPHALVLTVPPTAENLAKYCFIELNREIEKYSNATLENIRFYETPNNWADYNLTDYLHDYNNGKN